MRGLHDIIWWGMAGLLAAAVGTPAGALEPRRAGPRAAVVTVTVVNANGQALGRGSVPRAGSLTLLAPADAPMQRATPANGVLSDRRAVWTAAALGTASGVEVVLKPLGSVQGMRLVAVTDSGSEAIVLSDPQVPQSAPEAAAVTAATPTPVGEDTASAKVARQRAEIARLVSERDAAVRLAKARADSATAAETQQAEAARRRVVQDSIAGAAEAAAKDAAAKELAAREAARRKAAQDSADREARVAAAQETARRQAAADSVEREVQAAKARAAERIARLAAERDAAQRLAKARADSAAAVAAEQAAAQAAAEREAERLAAERRAAERAAAARARADSIAVARAAARRKAVEDSLELEAGRALEAKIQAERAAQREAERLAAAREAVRAAAAREAAAREARDAASRDAGSRESARVPAPAGRVNGTLADEWNAVREPAAPRSVADEWKAISGSAGRPAAPAGPSAGQPAAKPDATATPLPVVRETRAPTKDGKDARRETPRDLPRAEPAGAPKKAPQPGYSLDDLFRPTAQASPPSADGGGRGGGPTAQEIAAANARARQERARADSLLAARRREERARADSLLALRRERARAEEAAAWYRGEYLPPEERTTLYGDALLDDFAASTRVRGSLMVPGPLVSVGVERTLTSHVSTFGDVALRPGTARKQFSRTAAHPYAASAQLGARVLLEPHARTAYLQADAGVAWDADGAGVFRGGLSLGVVTPLVRSTLLDVGVRGLSVHDRRFVSPSAYLGLAARLGGGGPAYVTPESEP